MRNKITDICIILLSLLLAKASFNYGRHYERKLFTLLQPNPQAETSPPGIQHWPTTEEAMSKKTVPLTAKDKQDIKVIISRMKQNP